MIVQRQPWKENGNRRHDLARHWMTHYGRTICGRVMTSEDDWVVVKLGGAMGWIQWNEVTCNPCLVALAVRRRHA